MDKTRLRVKVLPLLSMIKIFATGLSVPLISLGIISGVLGLFGFDTVSLNGQPVHGITALIMGPTLGATITLFVACFFGLFTWLGLRIFCKFRPLEFSVLLDKAES